MKSAVVFNREGHRGLVNILSAYQPPTILPLRTFKQFPNLVQCLIPIYFDRFFHTLRNLYPKKYIAVALYPSPNRLCQPLPPPALMKMTSLFTCLLTALIFSLFISPIASTQISMTRGQAEEAKNHVTDIIENRLLRVLQGIEVKKKQLRPMQEALTRFLVPIQIEEAKMQADFQNAD